MRMDAKMLNAKGWDERVANGDAWTCPVDDDTIARALCDFHEDRHPTLLSSKYIPAAFATRARK